MNPFRIALSATTALVASTSLSFATVAHVVSQTVSYGASTNWGASTSTSGFTPSKTIALSGFDSSAGALTGVLITVTDTVNGTVNLTNNGTNSTDVSGQIQNTLNFILPNLTNRVSGNPIPESTLVKASSSYSQVLASGASSGQQAVSGAGAATFTSFSNLSVFSSPWTVTAGDLGQVLVSAQNSNGSAVYTDSGLITIKASYYYTPAVVPTPTASPAPEPATLAVLGTGLAGMGVLRRRKKAN